MQDCFFIRRVCGDFYLGFHQLKPIPQKISKIRGGAHQARIDVMRWIVRSPADGDRVVQRCADSAVDGQQGFVAGAVLQAFGFEVCNQLLIGDFCDLCIVCRKVRRDVRFYIVGKVGILLCGNICNLVIEPFKWISYDKLSKKGKRKHNQAKRQTWGVVSPVTRKPISSRAYNRRKAQDWRKDAADS